MSFTNAILFHHHNRKTILKNPFSSVKFKQPCKETEMNHIITILQTMDLPGLLPRIFSKIAPVLSNCKTIIHVAFDGLNVWLQNVSPKIGAMLRMRKTKRSSHCSWIKTTMLCTWHSLAVLSVSPSAAVSGMDHEKSELVFLYLH
jgi:hypothetical protein